MPILTFFFPGNGTLISESEAQMTCIKPVGAMNETVTSETPEPTQTTTQATGEASSGSVRLTPDGSHFAALALYVCLFAGLFGRRW